MSVIRYTYNTVSNLDCNWMEERTKWKTQGSAWFFSLSFAHSPFISLFSLSLQLQMKSVNWSEKRKEMNGMMNEVKWRKSGKWSARAFLYFPLFILHSIPSIDIVLCCSLYSVTNEVREPNKGTNNTLYLCLACSCSVVCCVGSEESEVRKRTLLSSLHTSQHSTKNKEWWCVVWERKKACFHYLSFFITIQHHSLLFFILLRFVLCSNHALHSFPLVFEQSTKKKKRNILTLYTGLLIYCINLSI